MISSEALQELWRMGVFSPPLPFGTYQDFSTGRTVKITINDFTEDPSSGSPVFTEEFLQKLSEKGLSRDAAILWLQGESPSFLETSGPQETTSPQGDTLQAFLEGISRELEDREETPLERYRRLVCN